VATSEVDICNQALSKLGEEVIASLDEKSPVGRLCNMFYQQTVDEVLRSYNWCCAIERQTLNLDMEVPITEDWAYQFSLPSEPYCLRIINTPETKLEPYVIEKRKMLTNMESVTVRYIGRITDPNEFDSGLVEAISQKLAIKMCIPITNDKSLRVELRDEYRKIIQEARRENQIESEQGPDEPLWVEAGRIA